MKTSQAWSTDDFSKDTSDRQLLVFTGNEWNSSHYKDCFLWKLINNTAAKWVTVVMFLLWLSFLIFLLMCLSTA